MAIAVILVTGYWFSQGNILPQNSNPVENGQDVPNTDTTAEINKNIGSDESESTSEVVNPGVNDRDSFYLIKKVNESIEVYYYEGEGEPAFIKSTDIEFSLLSNEDQKKFSNGIIAETEEELNEILQDFGS